MKGHGVAFNRVAKTGIPPEVESFVHQYIDSLEELEVLLLLHAERTRSWTPEQMHERIRSSVVSVTKNLAALMVFGVAEAAADVPGGYRYAPKSESLNRAITGLAEAYAQRRARVIELIFSKPSERLRGFSDAFKLKKDRDG